MGLGEEAGGGGAALIGVGLDEGDAGAVVHGHMDEVVAAAPPAGRGGTIPEAMPAALGDAGQLFDIEVHQCAGMRPLVAHGALGGPVEVGQARDLMPAQHAVDGGAGQAQQPSQPMRAPASGASRPQDPLLLLPRQGVRPAIGNRPAVGQAGDPVLAVAAQPAISCWPRALLRRGRRRHGPAVLHDALDQDAAPIRLQAPSTMSPESLLSDAFVIFPSPVWRLASVNQAHGKYT